MIRNSVGLLLFAAIYGFSIGAVHSPRLACWNLAKFPLLLVTTAALCVLAYYIACRFLQAPLRLLDVADLSIATYRNAALLLSGLSPVSLFLALTLEQPTLTALNEYPLFLGVNVVFIAICGSAALVRQALVLLRRYELSRTQVLQLVTAWLILSLGTGGQCAWYLRPFFGVRTIPVTRFAEGTQPDYRGATSFYEAVWHIIDPPPLPDGWHRHGH